MIHSRGGRHTPGSWAARCVRSNPCGGNKSKSIPHHAPNDVLAIRRRSHFRSWLLAVCKAFIPLCSVQRSAVNSIGLNLLDIYCTSPDYSLLMLRLRGVCVHCKWSLLLFVFLCHWYESVGCWDCKILQPTIFGETEKGNQCRPNCWRFPPIKSSNISRMTKSRNYLFIVIYSNRENCLMNVASWCSDEGCSRRTAYFSGVCYFRRGMLAGKA